ncbi:MAG: hypothetical protein JXQ72_15385 [Anaerolineae bacterium]|nr:hypothetical protein [Anaerolineae bacterium]
MTPDTNARVLVVAGMHRSGTSLVANWLESCGLYVGGNLVPADYSNPAGHYEDKDFSQFQRVILRDNGFNYLVAGGQPITVDAAHHNDAQHLIDARRDQSQWGWKDPRTTLLLDFWKTLLPGMRVLVVYRPYYQVADSLLRRQYKRDTQSVPGRNRAIKVVRRGGLRVKNSFANVSALRLYLRVWCRYNRDALAFAAAYPDSTLVMHVDDLLAHGNNLLAYINRTWDFALQPVDAAAVYDPALLTTDRMPLKSRWAARLVPPCAPIYAELERARQDTLARIGQ